MRHDWQKLTAFLGTRREPRVVLSLKEIEEVLGSRLPPTASSSNYWYTRGLKVAASGFGVNQRAVPPGHVGFVREGAQTGPVKPRETGRTRRSVRARDASPARSRRHRATLPGGPERHRAAPGTGRPTAWDGLIDRLKSVEREIVLSFDEVERLRGTPLSSRAREQQRYWSRKAYPWTKIGFRAYFRGVPPGHVAFVRDERLPVASDQVANKRASVWDLLLGELAKIPPGRDAVLSFERLEELRGKPLPPGVSVGSAFWCGKVRPWILAGFRASLKGMPDRHVRFFRSADAPGPRRAPPLRTRRPPPPPQAAPLRDPIPALGARKVVLIEGGRPTGALVAPAGLLYRSREFTRRRSYAESLGCPWFVLSPMYGLVSPHEEIQSYRRDMAAVLARSRGAWVTRVVQALRDQVGDLAGVEVEILADDAVHDVVAEPLYRRGAHIVARE